MARFDIVRGPPKEVLVSSLANGSELERKPVEFLIVESEEPTNQKQTLSFIIEGLEREDGSGQHWLFSGRCTSNNFKHALGKGFLSLETEVSSGWIEL